MPMSASILAYEDIQQVLDKALDSELGLVITFETRGAAIGFRQRCYRFRSLSHRTAELAFEEGDARYGTSIYDTLLLTLRDKKPGEKWTMEVRKRGTVGYNTQELKV